MGRMILAMLVVGAAVAVGGCWTPHLPQPRPPVIISQAGVAP